uniref:Uncharacterized protein n=1 Tax=Alexandrium catenella TaxID=2925 RepID=A0A7S1PVG0_ALECA
MAPRLLLLAVLPSLACGLRAPASGPHPASFGDIWQKSVGAVISDALEKSQADSQAATPKAKASDIVVKWNISAVEPESEVGVFWSHACHAKGKPEGNCSFVRTDKNPPGIRIKTSKPLDDKAHMSFTVDAKVLLVPYSMTVTCALCGEPCTVTPPLGPPQSMKMPDCPHPTDGFDILAEEIDLTLVPSFITVTMKTTTRLLRGDDSLIGMIVMETSL